MITVTWARRRFGIASYYLHKEWEFNNQEDLSLCPNRNADPQVSDMHVSGKILSSVF